MEQNGGKQTKYFAALTCRGRQNSFITNMERFAVYVRVVLGEGLGLQSFRVVRECDGQALQLQSGKGVCQDSSHQTKQPDLAVRRQDCPSIQQPDSRKFNNL